MHKRGEEMMSQTKRPDHVDIIGKASIFGNNKIHELMRLQRDPISYVNKTD